MNHEKMKLTMRKSFLRETTLNSNKRLFDTPSYQEIFLLRKPTDTKHVEQV